MKTEEKKNTLFYVPWEESPLAEDFEPGIFGILRLELIVKPYICLPQTDKACWRATFAGQTASPREVRRLSGTSAPEGGELTTVL